MPPYSDGEATMWSPASAMFRNAIVSAAWPLDTSSAPTTVEVVASDYVGRPVQEVTKALEKLGLVVQAQPDPESTAPKHEVLSVQEGTFEQGDTVAVTYSDAKPGGGGDDEGGDR